MANNNKHTGPNVPALRFPEFSEEWEYKSLGEIGESLIGLTYSPSDVVKEGGTIVFRSSNIQDGVINYGDLVRVSKKIKDSIITRDGDLLICARNGSTRLIGKNALLKKTDEGQTFGAFMMVFRSIDNRFVHQLLSTKAYSTQVSENLGARINQITTRNFAEYTFGMPQTSEEKEKIGTFLELINDRIETQSKIIEEQETLLKSLADSLISSQVANMALNDSVVARSSTMKESEIENSGPFPVFGASGLCGYSNEALEESDSILVTKDGSGVGTCQYATGAHSFLGTLCSLIAKEGTYLPYVYYALLNFNFASFKTGLAIPHIYFKDYGNAIIYCPSYDEQVRIASGLEKIEAKIKSEKEILKQYQLQKEYLLSRMFI